jgi:hypothetical protein
MSTYKNISDNWYITVDSGAGTIYVDGNLDVTGNITYVSEIAVNDAFIIAAANNSSTANVANVGFLAGKPTTPISYAGLKYNATVGAWQIATDVYANGAPNTASYSNIVTTTTTANAAGSNTQIQFNDGGAFGASGNLTFDKTTNQLSVFFGSQVLGNTGSAPGAVANAVVLYNQAPGIGASGIYARTSTTQDELISATTARLYSIIF